MAPGLPLTRLIAIVRLAACTVTGGHSETGFATVVQHPVLLLLGVAPFSEEFVVLRA